MKYLEEFNAKPPSQYFSETNTDKGGYQHNYSWFYDTIFSALLYRINGPLRVLEIGVSFFYGLGSGHAFCRMPYVERFIGIDQNPLRAPFENNKGIFIQADAYEQETVDKAAQYGPFHLIIDDGWHQHEGQVAFFRLYTALCDKISIMACEDVIKAEINSRLEEIGDKSLHVLQVPALFANYTDNNMIVRFNL